MDPALFGLGVAAGCLALFKHGRIGFCQTLIDLGQFLAAFDLDAEMFNAGPGAAGADREIDAWVLEHPFGVIGFFYRRCGREQRGIEAD